MEEKELKNAKIEEMSFGKILHRRGNETKEIIPLSLLEKARHTREELKR